MTAKDSNAPLQLYNTLTRQKEIFRPIDPANVRMYVCGPTVYDYAHIGNGRAAIVFDQLFRLLRHRYGADHVTYARNITDVDDKINERAAQSGIKIRELTEKTTRIYHEDVAALGCLSPTIEPRATEHIAEMVAVIQKLIENGHAYAADGHVLFSVPSMPEYGGLARRSLDEMIAGARVEVADYKRNETDFVLWKPSQEGEPGWETPWGRGRPGWHLECSAMSWKHLGETFDIHGGGIDLVFPHHENEIAQTRCAFGHDVMANYWMHNGFLQVEGEKMSKSLGNFITIHDLLHSDVFGGKRWDGQVLRLAILRTHYRQPIDFTVRGLEDAQQALDSWMNAASEDIADELPDTVLSPMLDDMNTPLALSEVYKLARQKEGRQLSRALEFFGFNVASYKSGVRRALEDAFVKAGLSDEKINTLIAARLEARKQKNWAESDRIRDELAAMGIQLKDGKNPDTGEMETTWEVKR